MSKLPSSRLAAFLSSAQGLLLTCFFFLSLRIDSVGAIILQALYMLCVLGTVVQRYLQWRQQDPPEKE